MIKTTSMIKKICIAAVSLFVMFGASATYVLGTNGGITAEAAREMGLGLRIGLVSRGTRNVIDIQSRVINVGFYAMAASRRKRLFMRQTHLRPYKLRRHMCVLPAV